MKNCDEIVHDLLERRDEYMKLKKEKMKKTVIACAATLCTFTVVFIVGFALSSMKQDINKNAATNIASNDDENEVSTNNQKINDKNLENNSDKENITEEKKYAIYTESIMLPKDIGGDVQYDMIGCLYYKGSVYTQAGDYYSGEKLENAKKLLDKKIGEAKGTLNEWSLQEEWATELASTYSGSVYTVKGYSEDFRLFVYSNIDGEEWINGLENYDGIGLNTGSDLFEERLHLAGNVEKIRYQTHEDWDEAKGRFKELDGISDKDWEKFIKKVYQSPFEAIDYQKNRDFYDTELQGHLYLEMKDGTEVEMRLIDGGYVGTQNLGWYYVKMPGEIFDKVMEACQG